VLLWMCVIFSASGDPASLERSSRIIGPVVRWLFPHLSDNAVHAIVFIIRKCAHVTEYAVLALLLWHALPKPDASPWSWPKARLTLALVALYAAGDELHQAIVPSRQAAVGDVLLDTLGAALALLLLWALSFGRRKSRSAPASPSTPGR
jgi:VanZ family protein